MTKGKPITKDLRWAIVRMHSLGVPVEKIWIYTDVSKRQIYRIINRFLMTGKVLSATQRRKTGRTRHLNTDNVAYLQGCLDQSCDKYLEELQLGLEETCGRSVLLSTIWRALKRSGYTMVKLTRVAIERSVAKRARFIYSVLPAISLDGILYVSILEGSFTTATFVEFIDGLLDTMNPFPGPNSVIVMDNCCIHKADVIREMIEERCA
ncbi:hypothetical protein B0H19DRAFT_1059746 [Mycena capillaripes]|nr:hypothetical protein B0H19DRAFT_1059746 [Mycena capillaripes]